MKTSIWIVLFLVSLVQAYCNVQLERPLYVPDSDDNLSYDDGSAAWFSWGGTYRGVWFNLNDFGLSGGCEFEGSEFWFYHSAEYPWDTSAFYAMVYNGTQDHPASFIDATSVTAAHYAAVYGPPASTEDQFWVILNTNMSDGGWPSVLGDPTYTTDHSFFSDDLIVWEPWGLGDYYIRVSDFQCDLENETWGSIKTLFY